MRPCTLRSASVAATMGLLLGAFSSSTARTSGRASSGFEFVTMWGTAGSGPGEFRDPLNLDVSPSGDVYVADLGNWRVQKFDSSGKFIREWAVQDSSPFSSFPWGVAVARDGSVYVGSDYSVTQYTEDGAFVRRWGTYGRTPGRLFHVQDVSVDEDKNIYVCQIPDRRWDKFDSLGAFQGEWTLTGNGYPNFIEVGPDGRVYVSDHTNAVIQVFGPDGAFIRTLGIPASGGAGTNLVGRPAVTPLGIVYAPDRSESRIAILTTDGGFLGSFGSPGTGPGQFSWPSCVARDDAGNLYVMDPFNSRVQKFEPVTTAVTETTWGALKSRYK